MKLKDLKKSTLYQSSDLDDMEVMLCVSRDGKQQYEPLCFMGWVPLEGHEFVVLGGLTEVQRLVETGKMKKPEGFIPSSETKDIIEGNDVESASAHFDRFLTTLDGYLYQQGWYTNGAAIREKCKTFEEVEAYLSDHCYSKSEAKELVAKLRLQSL
jgi:hypothetical protein